MTKINKKQTGKKVAHLASQGLQSPTTSKSQRKIDVSAVSQAPLKKTTKTKSGNKSAKKAGR